MQILCKLVYYCLLLFMLLILSISDLRFRIIPPKCIQIIFWLGVVHLLFDLSNWLDYIEGFLTVSVLLFFVSFISRGHLIGGGDIKMMAVCGLVLGRELIWIAFIIGCMTGLVVHSIRMKIDNSDNHLPMGPYLSIGVIAAIVYSEIELTSVYC